MQSFWQENIRHWQKTTGVWACAMGAVVIAAHHNAPASSVSVQTAQASTTLEPSPVAAHAIAHQPNVKLSYSPLDLTVLNAASYGDSEI